MTRKLVSMLLSILILASLSSALAEDTSVTVTDMKGREVSLDKPATRIVALTASECEILCAIGAENLLVGRGEYCDYPESIQDLPVLQSGAETNVEQIIALEPDAVMMSEMAQSTEQVEALEAAGIRVILCDADDIPGTYTAIHLAGALTGLNAEAEALIADMQATFDDIAAKSGNTGKTVYFEVSPLQWGLWTAGSNTFMNELAAMCGLTNAFADIDGWAVISEEQIIERNPDYIVTITMYFGEGPLPEEEIMGRAGWSDITAVVNGDVFNADSNEVSRPGPRLKNAAIALYNFVNHITEE